MARYDAGFSLLEVLVALLLLGLLLLATVPMFVYATYGTRTGADLSFVGAAAQERLEILRATKFADLPMGGSLTSNVTSFSDLTNPDVIIRWQIIGSGSPVTKKTIYVRAVARRQYVGQAKDVVISTLRARL